MVRLDLRHDDATDEVRNAIPISRRQPLHLRYYRVRQNYLNGLADSTACDLTWHIPPARPPPYVSATLPSCQHEPLQVHRQCRNRR